MYAQVTTWWTILRIALEERLVYRGDFALGTLMRFLPIITQIFLWWAIFQSIATEEAATRLTEAVVDGARKLEPDIRGYTYENFVAYYLLTMMGRAFSSMPGLASGVAKQVRDGEIKKFLVQPIDFVGFQLLSRVAHKMAYYSVAIGPFALVYYLCRGYFPGWPDATTMLAFVASLFLGFALGFFMEISIGMVSFWFLEVSSLLFLYMLLSFFLSGHMFPLDMIPEPWGFVVQCLPLRYLAYFPAAVFLGKIHGPALAWGLAIEFAWVLFFIVACRVLLKRGLKQYSGYGG